MTKRAVLIGINRYMISDATCGASDVAYFQLSYK